MNDQTFGGIPAEGRLLLAENRFYNSRDFYEENKERIKSLTTVPARELASLLSETLVKIDDRMETDPVKMVSRVRRDTRYSRDKTLYRENMWVMFMRNKRLWTNQPCMWFEFFPSAYTYGIGTFRPDSRFFELFRQKLAEEPERFRKAVRQAQSIGAVLEFENRYKKDKYTGFPAEVNDFANSRGFYCIYKSEETQRLSDGRILGELKAALEAFTPLYRFLIEVTEQAMQ